jgi:hypothetical protein
VGFACPLFENVLTIREHVVLLMLNACGCAGECSSARMQINKGALNTAEMERLPCLRMKRKLAVRTIAERQ